MPRSERRVARSPGGGGTPESPFLPRAGCTPHPATVSPGQLQRRPPRSRPAPPRAAGPSQLTWAQQARPLPCSPAAARRCHLLLAFGGRCPLPPIPPHRGHRRPNRSNWSQSGKILRQHTRRLPTRPRLRRPLSPAAPLGAPAAARTLSSATDLRQPAGTAARHPGNTRTGGELHFPPPFQMSLRYGIGGRGSQIPRLPPSEGLSTSLPQRPPLDSLPISRCLGGIPTPSPPSTHGPRRLPSTGWGRGYLRWPSAIAAGQGGTARRQPLGGSSADRLPPLPPRRVSSRRCRPPVPSASAGRRNSHRGAFPQNFSACGPGGSAPLRSAQQAALLTWQGPPRHASAGRSLGRRGGAGLSHRPPAPLPPRVPAGASARRSVRLLERLPAGTSARRRLCLPEAVPAAPPLPCPALRLRARRQAGREGGESGAGRERRRRPPSRSHRAAGRCCPRWGSAALLLPGAGCGSHPPALGAGPGPPTPGPTEGDNPACPELRRVPSEGASAPPSAHQLPQQNTN